MNDFCCAQVEIKIKGEREKIRFFLTASFTFSLSARVWLLSYVDHHTTRHRPPFSHFLSLSARRRLLCSTLFFNFRNVVIKGMTILAPLNAPNSDGINSGSLIILAPPLDECDNNLKTCPSKTTT
ncbi:hypothetical protein P8452_38769 [Trifolium repens]|nr:hypothetical protein P8452_38769 [Trifolium repens]